MIIQYDPCCDMLCMQGPRIRTCRLKKEDNAQEYTLGNSEHDIYSELEREHRAKKQNVRAIVCLNVSCKCAKTPPDSLPVLSSCPQLLHYTNWFSAIWRASDS